jgi:Holliday junction resolvase
MSYQEEIIKAYEKDGYLVLKTIRLNKSGFPDIIALKDGNAVFIEVKEENDTLKPLQKKRIDALKKQGFNAFCVQKNKGVIY